MSVIFIFISCPFSVYASDHGGSGGSDHNSNFITDSGTINVKDDGVVMYYIEYILSNIGAVLFDHDISKAMANDQTMKEYISKGKYDATEKKVTFPKETVTYVYNTFNTIAKENQPFTVEKTYKMSLIPASTFGNKAAYDYFKSYFDSDSYKYVIFSAYSSGNGRIADITSMIKEGGGFVKYGIYFVDLYDSEWRDCQVPTKNFVIKTDENGDSYVDVTDAVGNYKFDAFYHYKEGRTNFGNEFVLVTKDGGNIRVFNTVSDFINYSVGQRKIYYTSNYYNYVPEDLTVSIDELQKTIEDMQDVIDKLLDQITNDTSESEIEDLLRLILEELRNQQGGGGGSGGGGDVNVDIDLSMTNGLLSKILAKVTQIFDKISETAGGAVDAVDAKLQETLDAILSTLRTISGDVNDIKGQLETMSEQEFNEKSDSFLGEIMDALSEISEVVKTKFPFSIPNDLRIFLSKIAPAPPETEEQQIESYSLDTSSGISLYSGEHGGGGTSDGETNPPGGGGASRPGSGFVDVDHGGSGGSRDPVEMREAPVFRLPIVIERYGIEEYIIIDMAPFDPLSRFSRGFFTIIFMVCLFNLTFKVIGMWGDLIG